jgi:hypothetical protein
MICFLKPYSAVCLQLNGVKRVRTADPYNAIVDTPTARTYI